MDNLHPISIFVGSVYGNATDVAQTVKSALSASGLASKVYHSPDLTDFEQAKRILVICSTTGRGDVPQNLARFVLQLQMTTPDMCGKPFSVIGIGDTSYGDSFCGAARKIFQLLTDLGGEPMTELLAIDVSETLLPEEVVLPWIERQVQNIIK